jgi:hypothetical protein
LYFSLLPQTVHREDTVQFLRELKRTLRASMTVLWDGGSVHSKCRVKAFMAKQSDIIAETLPTYGRLANLAADSTDQLAENVVSDLRTALEKQHGEHRAVKHFVHVLHLLDEQPIELVQRAIEMRHFAAADDVETILFRVHSQRPDHTPISLERSQQPELVRDVNVPLPDPSKFNQFLSHGEPSHEGSE